MFTLFFVRVLVTPNVLLYAPLLYTMCTSFRKMIKLRSTESKLHLNNIIFSVFDVVERASISDIFQDNDRISDISKLS